MLEYLIRVLFFIVIKESLTALLSFLQYSEYIKKEDIKSSFLKLARSRGFEPLTHSLEGCCSIQLS